MSDLVRLRGKIYFTKYTMCIGNIGFAYDYPKIKINTYLFFNENEKLFFCTAVGPRDTAPNTYQTVDLF